jgi:hypothetical protein
LARRHTGARHSPVWFTRLISPFAPCFSLLSPFFSLFRGDPGFNIPPKTVCFPVVDQKTPSRAEQEDNREIIRTYQGGNREITGAEQDGADSTGSSRMRRHSAPIQPLEMWRLIRADPSEKRRAETAASVESKHGRPTRWRGKLPTEDVKYLGRRL